MAKFVYVGGKEWDDSELPPVTNIFGLRFIEGVERDVGLRDFKTPNEFEHAIKKLNFHPHFKRVDEVADVVEQPAPVPAEVPVKRTWSRKKKVEAVNGEDQ